MTTLSRTPFLAPPPLKNKNNKTDNSGVPPSTKATPALGNYNIKAECDLKGGEETLAHITGIGPDWDILNITTSVCERYAKKGEECTKLFVTITEHNDATKNVVTTEWNNGSMNIEFPKRK
tara:strand:- start:189 stop:551 length:363 start_codon:yes stop_codon:yes gene_type:complete